MAVISNFLAENDKKKAITEKRPPRRANRYGGKATGDRNSKLTTALCGAGRYTAVGGKELHYGPLPRIT
ncbi:hypothetical protein J6590_016819 [Homalodisca vitripennis]|nr:hypothetical protein J6590_016819 [Homalodisca vitripennis]